MLTEKQKEMRRFTHFRMKLSEIAGTVILVGLVAALVFKATSGH